MKSSDRFWRKHTTVLRRGDVAGKRVGWTAKEVKRLLAWMKARGIALPEEEARVSTAWKKYQSFAERIAHHFGGHRSSDAIAVKVGPQALNHKPYTLNPQPSTLNPKL